VDQLRRVTEQSPEELGHVTGQQVRLFGGEVTAVWVDRPALDGV
jgi:hypothetical protein